MGFLPFTKKTKSIFNPKATYVEQRFMKVFLRASQPAVRFLSAGFEGFSVGLAGLLKRSPFCPFETWLFPPK